MTLFVIALFVVVLQCLIKRSNGFQVIPDSSDIFKRAIEKSIMSKVISPPLTIVDDKSFPPDIPCNFAGKTSTRRTVSIEPGVLSESLGMTHENNPFSVGYDPVALPLYKSIFTKIIVPPARRANPRKRFGFDNDPAEYWFNNRIHTFGNTGLFGGLHAAMAPIATKLIDDKALRTACFSDSYSILQIAKDLFERVQTKQARVLDMCCGVGMSTRALESSFLEAELVLGVDTSPEMIAMARAMSSHDIAISRMTDTWNPTLKNAVTKLLSTTAWGGAALIQNSDGNENTMATFARGNAERLKLPDASFDLVTVMYALHETPKSARYRILREARRLLKDGGTLAVVDISPKYMPSYHMLAGEPYVLEYQKNIEKQMQSLQGFSDFEYKSVVPGHVCSWVLTRQKGAREIV